MYSIYIKTHNITGLKYLGYTSRIDVHAYYGSGKRWLNHLKKHGKLYTTEIIFETDNIDDVALAGEVYSSLFQIVSSNRWANLIEEKGNWFPYEYVKTKTFEKYGVTNVMHIPKIRDKVAANSKDTKKRLKELGLISPNYKISASQREKNYKNKWGVDGYKQHYVELGKLAKGSKHKTSVNHSTNMENRWGDPDQRLKIIEACSVPKPEYTCPHCNYTGRGGNMKRYHFDNCKLGPK